MRSRTVVLSWTLALVAVVPLACQNTSDLINTTTDTTTDTTTTTDTSNYAGTVSDAQAANDAASSTSSDCTVSSSAVALTLNGSTITASGAGVSIAGSVATITAAGTYRLSGTLTDGQIIVDAGDAAVVKLVLNGVDIRSSTSAPIYIQNADDVFIVLADGSSNYLQDAATYVLADATSDEPNAAIFSTADLSFCGAGALTVVGQYNDGIACKDSLVINNGAITVNAADDGIRGKDCVIVRNGTLAVTSGGDGLKSDNDTDATRGYIDIEAGTINVTAGGDAITAETDVMFSGGALTLSAGGGSTATISDSASAKGIKAGVNVIIEGGTFSINTAEDAIHSNGAITISGGTFAISAKDDGVHADAALTVNGGTLRITKCYEGLESRTVITVNNGDIYVVASDDGFNVAGGTDGSAMDNFPQPGVMEDISSYHMYINGGRIAVHANGDGLDCGGPIDMTGGVVLVDGPSANDNGALDYGGYFKITGGFLIATGSAGMAQAPSTTSTQYSVKITFNSNKAANSLVRLQQSGSDLFTFAPTKTYRSVVFSSPVLTAGTAYDLYTGGSCTGTVTDGLYDGGTYTPGTKSATFTESSILTNVTAP